MSKYGQMQPTIHHSIDPDALIRPIAAGSADYPAGFRIAPHRHRSAQLVYASAGVMVVASVVSNLAVCGASSNLSWPKW